MAKWLYLPASDARFQSLLNNFGSDPNPDPRPGRSKEVAGPRDVFFGNTLLLQIQDLNKETSFHSLLHILFSSVL